jgi:hypothetical protein
VIDGVTSISANVEFTAFVMDNNIREVPTHVVEVRELNAPKGSDALHWVLYTKEPGKPSGAASKL